MFTGIASHTGVLVTAMVVLIGGAIVYGGAAVADPNQDEQFLALLEEKEIPAIENVPRVIAAAQKVCRKLDGGMPVKDLLDGLINDAYNIDPAVRQYPARLTTTVTRFITAAVQIYCPYDHSKIASIMANRAAASAEPRRRHASHAHNTVNSGSDLREPPLSDMISMSALWQEPPDAVRLPHTTDGGAFVAGRLRDGQSDWDPHGAVLASLIGTVFAGDPLVPNPPQLPSPPPTVQILTPPAPIAPRPPSQQPPPPPQEPPPQELPPPPQEPPPPPQQPPPPPQEPPPPPQQVEPSAAAPQPGGTGGNGGSGGGGGGGSGRGGNGANSGGDPVEPPPVRPASPGFIQLAP
ncbi:DUF732 domain-containing protein [Mycobacterium kansasii]|uniref:DUF732 domain-containing protein n=1 Tax=Mycobacterium kansasii TaxID=1768 RepID=UPI00056C628F|nr:DUF732 domain-containing protein [Mycobacterium kansasii]